MLLDQYVHGAAHPAVVAFGGNGLLQRHQGVLAGLGDVGIHRVGQLSSGGAVLWREGEHAHVIEALAPQELHQVLEVLLRFAWKAHDQGGAQHRIGELVADLIQQPVVHIRLPGAVHRPQHLRVAVLQRQIQIGHHIGHLPVGRQHLWCQTRRVGVVHADPGDLDLPQGPQQFRQLWLAV